MPRKAYTEHKCEKCGSLHSTPQSKYSHKKRCRGPPPVFLQPTILEDMVKLKDEVLSLRSDLAQLLSASVGGPKSTTPTTTVINNTTTNNNHSTTHNHFNQFRKEDLSYIAHEMVRDLIKQKDLNASLQEMVKLIHFNEKQPNNINVYVGSESDERGLFLNAQKSWQDIGVGLLAERVMLDAVMVLSDHHEEFEKEYDDKESNRFDKFCQNYQNYPEPLKDTIATMVQNKSIVEQQHPSVTKQRLLTV